jgi:hypothetical protein
MEGYHQLVPKLRRFRHLLSVYRPVSVLICQCLPTSDDLTYCAIERRRKELAGEYGKGTPFAVTL